MKSITIVGTGISGLSAAHFIRKKFPDCTVYLIESNHRVGGNFNTENSDGFLFEFGPRGVLKSSHAFFHLLESANLWHLLIPGKKTSSRRYVWYNNQLEQLGGNPFKVFSSPLMKGVISAVWKERNLTNQKQTDDESLQDFFERRFGKHITHNLLDAFITGVWAGDISKLSAKATFPNLVDGEAKHHSVVRGFFKMKKERRLLSEKETTVFSHPVLPKSRFFSVQGGLQQLAEKLAEPFQSTLFLNHSVTHLEKPNNEWKITLNDHHVISSEHILFATPSYVTGKILRSLDHELADALTKIEYVPVAVVNLGYNKLPSGSEGFGFLVPNNQQKKILGIIFNSGTFDHVAPNGGKNFTVMLGGARHQEVFAQTEDDLMDLALEAMKEHLDIHQKPDVIRTKKWIHAIPQYNVGYQDLLDKITSAQKRHQNLHFAGNWKGGIGINDCVKSSYYLINNE